MLGQVQTGPHAQGAQFTKRGQSPRTSVTPASLATVTDSYCPSFSEEPSILNWRHRGGQPQLACPAASQGWLDSMQGDVVPARDVPPVDLLAQGEPIPSEVDPSGLEHQLWNVLETYPDSHAEHTGRVGGGCGRSSCGDSINCHTYAIGKPSPMSDYENKSRPDTVSHPGWNKEPSDELAKYYQPVNGPSKRGDVIVYGSDLNQDGKLGGFVNVPNPNGKGGFIPVAEIQHSAVITGASKSGQPVVAQSVMGRERVEHSPYHPKVMSMYNVPDPYGRGNFTRTPSTAIYRLNQGANPGRTWGH